MKRDDWLKLPLEVQDFVWNDITEVNEQFTFKYNLSYEQFEFINVLEDRIILQIISPLDLPKELEGIPDKQTLDLRALALDIAIEILAPLQEYIKDVDRLILRLGGKVPKVKSLKAREQNKNEFSDFVEGDLKFLMDEFSDFKDERVSSKKIIDKEGRKVRPSIENWLKDYVHFLGAGNHTSLDRAKYLASSKNVRDLSEEEKENISRLLLSYDEAKNFVFEKRDGILKIEKIQVNKKPAIEEQRTIDTVLAEIKNDLADLQQKIVPDEFILGEIDNDPAKLSGLLWDNIGLVDKEMAISCIGLMIRRKSFDGLVKQDKRFRSILLRFLNVKYGKKFDNFVDKNEDKLINRRLILEMILQEKLKFSDEESVLIAFYLTNLIPGSGQVVYLDKKYLSLKWREVQLLGENIAWVV